MMGFDQPNGTKQGSARRARLQVLCCRRHIGVHISTLRAWTALLFCHPPLQRLLAVG